MWIAIRLVLAVIGFAIRQWRRRGGAWKDGSFGGVPYAAKVSTNKGKVTRFRIGMPRRSPTWVRLHAESAVDRWFKRLGIANETQTGDATFDAKVYVTCDHPTVEMVLRDSPALRAAIVAAIAAGYRLVRFDGQTVWLERASDERPGERDLGLLKAIHDASEPLERDSPSWLRDPFLWKALIVEGVVWAIFGYAIGAAIEMFAHREDYHVRPNDVIPVGLAAAAGLFAILLGVIALWMRGSSRGHRVIVESALVLLLGLPITGIQVIGDTNRGLDNAPPTEITRAVDDCQVREHRGRRGRRWYSYHVWLEPEAELRGPDLPRSIETTRGVCAAAEEAGRIDFEIGPGRWGLPWFRRIRAGDVTWTAP